MALLIIHVYVALNVDNCGMYTFHMLAIECAHSTAETCGMYTFNG